MDGQKKADHSFIVAVVVLTAIVFVLELMTPLGIAIWALYVLPLGLTRWSSLGSLTFAVAGGVYGAYCSGLSLFSSRRRIDLHGRYSLSSIIRI
jgi:hypothetical protein